MVVRLYLTLPRFGGEYRKHPDPPLVGKSARTGAMAEYVVADPALCWHMGTETTFAQAATVGVGLVSATFSLCKLLGYPYPPGQSDDTSPVGPHLLPYRTP